MRSHISAGLTLSFLALTVGAASATTKGLNQIVTPDVQPYGQFSVSLQDQGAQIGDPYEVQLELGITHNFEAAYFQGFVPGEEILGVEYGIVAKGPWLLSTGVTGISPRGSTSFPFIEGGYYEGQSHIIAGVGRTLNQTQTILGYAYILNSRLTLQADYQSGDANSLTGGFTYALTPSLSFNPSLYLNNGSGNDVYGYAVLTYTFKAY